MAVLFRREKSPDAARTIRLNGVDPGSSYEIVAEGSAEKRVEQGRAMAALKVELPSAPGSLLLYYRRVR